MSDKLRENVLQKGLRLSFSIIGPLLFTAFLSQSSFAQTLVAIPNCGKAGETQVCVTGSGWAEPSPPCFYRFFFDGAQVVSPDQPDGLFGPPRRKFTVPAGATVGMHKIKVELRISATNQLLQAKEIPFNVVANIKDPFTPAPAFTGARIDITFDPTDACQVGPCSKRGFIQVIKEIGTKADGTTRPLNPNEFKNYDPTGELTNNTTTDFFRVDRLAGRKEPYYGGNGAGTGTWTPGSNETGKPVTPATMTDTPRTSEGNWPADITQKVTREFEVAVFCIAGDDRGKLLGTFRWKFEKVAGMPSTSMLVSPPSMAAPSQDFTNALNKWLANHPDFKLPQPKFPTCP